MERKTKGGGALSAGTRADVKEKDRNGTTDFLQVRMFSSQIGRAIRY